MNCKRKNWVIGQLLEIFTGEYHEKFNTTNAEYLISLWNTFSEYPLETRHFEFVNSEFHSLIYSSQKSSIETNKFRISKIGLQV